MKEENEKTKRRCRICDTELDEDEDSARESTLKLLIPLDSLTLQTKRAS